MTEPTLQSLRAQGAPQHDPLRFHYLEALERRMSTQTPAVQRLLACKLQAEINAWADAEHPATDSQKGPIHRPSQARLNHLGQLNRDIAARTTGGADRPQPQGPGNPTALRSARQFSQVWSKIAADTAVQHTLSTGPDNAGPLNPHRLMLRSLSLMRTLSPDYLRHFWSYMDSLLWLEQMHANTATPPAKPVRKAQDKGLGRARPTETKKKARASTA